MGEKRRKGEQRKNENGTILRFEENYSMLYKVMHTIPSLKTG